MLQGKYSVNWERRISIINTETFLVRQKGTQAYKYSINVIRVTCAFFQPSTLFGLMDEGNSFSTASRKTCTQAKKHFINLGEGSWSLLTNYLFLSDGWKKHFFFSSSRTKKYLFG